MAGNQEHSYHVALDALWKFRADNTPLSQDELNHLCGCNQCLNYLSMCQSSETIEQARRLQQLKLKRPADYTDCG